MAEATDPNLEKGWLGCGRGDGEVGRGEERATWTLGELPGCRGELSGCVGWVTCLLDSDDCSSDMTCAKGSIGPGRCEEGSGTVAIVSEKSSNNSSPLSLSESYVRFV